jgi:hypothetical protein
LGKLKKRKKEKKSSTPSGLAERDVAVAVLLASEFLMQAIVVRMRHVECSLRRVVTSLLS